MKLGQVLLGMAGFLFVAEGATWDKQKQEVLRQEVEMDLLRNSVQYLKGRLVKCLKQQTGGRTKVSIEEFIDDYR